MKPGRRSAARSTPDRRSGGNRAMVAMVVMGVLVLLYGWNSYFLAPKSKAKAEVAKELAASRQQEAEYRKNLAELKKLANDTQAREAELARLGRLIPAEADVAGAILTLNELAAQAQVAWSSFVPSPPAPGVAGAAATSINMKIQGTFSQIFDYLRRLEQLERLVVVDSIQLGAGAGGSGSPVLDADIKGRMFSAGSVAPAAGTTAGAKNTAGDSDPAKLAKAGG